ncbi:MAG: hypothetical protein U0R19_14730 [Bryobacteraceae bacterium]
MSQQQPDPEHVFNDDLLLNPGDLAYAKKRFPKILHVLDFPTLKAKFRDYDEEAGRSRDKLRRLGSTVILAGAISLIAVATKPVWPNEPALHWLALALELGGLLAAIAAAGGFLLGPWKNRWLEKRLMTERMRQWHFQLLLNRGKEIENSCQSSAAQAEFERNREQWFADFLQSYQGHLDGKLSELLSGPTLAKPWLHTETQYSPGPIFHTVCDAYRQLRFEHQAGYAAYKLKDETRKPVWNFLSWPARLQLRIFSGCGAICFFAAIACSLVLIYGHTFHLPPQIHSNVGISAIVVALIGAALHSMQEGLGLERDIERYYDYQCRVVQLTARFQASAGNNEKIHLMQDLEMTSVEELIGFLRTHKHARFLFG